MKPDKGHAAELAAVIGSISRGEPMPIPFASLVDTTLVTFAALDACGQGQPVAIDRLRRRLAEPDEVPT